MKRRHRKPFLLGLCLAFFGGLLIFSEACNKGSQGGSADSTTLKIGVMPSVDYLPIAVAQEQGFFKRPIKLVRFSSPMERDAALQTAEVDASVTDYMGAMLLHAKGLPISLSVACQGSFRLVFGRDDKLTDISHLRGKHIGLSSNTLIEYATERALVDATGKPFSYTRVEVQKIPIRLEMLRSGELDAAILPEPFASTGQALGLLAIEVPGGLTQGITGLLFQNKALERSDDLRAFVAGYNEAVSFMQSHPRSAWIGALGKLLGITKQQAEQIQLPDYQPVTAPSPEALQPILSWMKEKKLVPQDYTAEGLIVALPQ